jgi:hypothetical protein
MGLIEAARTAGRIESSQLLRVLGIGQLRHNAQLDFELIAVEVRLAGGVIHWRATSHDSDIEGPPDVELRDDQGTPYEAGSSSWSSATRRARGTTYFAPTLPAGLTTLRVLIRALGPPSEFVEAGLRDKAIQGGFEFEIEVPGEGGTV